MSTSTFESVFGKRVLMLLENRRTPDYSLMNEFMVGIENIPGGHESD